MQLDSSSPPKRKTYSETLAEVNEKRNEVAIATAMLLGGTFIQRDGYWACLPQHDDTPPRRSSNWSSRQGDAAFLYLVTKGYGVSGGFDGPVRAVPLWAYYRALAASKSGPPYE